MKRTQLHSSLDPLSEVFDGLLIRSIIAERLSEKIGLSNGSLLEAREHYKSGTQKFYISIWPAVLDALLPKTSVVQLL